VVRVSWSPVNKLHIADAYPESVKRPHQYGCRAVAGDLAFRICVIVLGLVPVGLAVMLLFGR